MLRKLNSEAIKSSLANKSLTDVLYKDVCKLPRTVLKSIGGVIFNANGQVISKKEAIQVVLEEKDQLILKASTDTSRGKGVVLVNEEVKQNLLRNIQDDSWIVPNNDFVLQQMVEQSDETKVFNPSSLNCMRITTLNLNGVVSVCSRAIKCGPKDSVVDNIGTGRRGVIVGLSPEGYLNEAGFYGNGDQATEHHGVQFEGKKIEHFDKVADAALSLHKLTDKCKIIGWDIALDSNNDPVLIEGNVKYPGIVFEQVCSGPIFGERTEEVIDYLRKA